MFLPELYGILFTHNKQRGGQGITADAFPAHDGHGKQPVLSGIAGFRVDDMPPDMAVFIFEIPLISAGGNDGLIGNRQDAGIVAVGGRLNSDAPRASVLFFPDRLDVSPEIQNGGSDASVPQQLTDPVAGISLGYASEINRHSCGKRHDIAVQPQGCVIHDFQQGSDHFLRRHVVFTRRKAPFPDKRIDGDIQCPVSLSAEFQSLPQQKCRLIGNPGFAGCIQLMDFACVQRHGYQVLQCSYFIFGSFQQLIAAAGDTDGHMRIHGEEGSASLFLWGQLRTGGKKQQREESSEQQPRNMQFAPVTRVHRAFSSIEQY